MTLESIQRAPREHSLTQITCLSAPMSVGRQIVCASVTDNFSERWNWWEKLYATRTSLLQFIFQNLLPLNSRWSGRIYGLGERKWRKYECTQFTSGQAYFQKIVIFVSLCAICVWKFIWKETHFENILDFSFPFLQLSPFDFRKGFCSASWQPFRRFLLFIYLNVESSFFLDAKNAF